MAQPVWVLSVDLQAKTATFQSGMAEAAKSARGAFMDIKSGSSEAGREVGTNMMEARHGVMMLGEEFGIHLPRALTSFIASIGPIGAAMEAAFPFLAIAVGATLLLEHLAKVHEAGEKLTEDQMKFGTAIQTAFNGLDEKLLQAGIRTDELRSDHLGALKKQLELIDAQSMDELVKSFDTVAKAADAVFANLKTSWYQSGIGAAGAQHALIVFKDAYDSLLAQGRTSEAADLLRGTKASAESILFMQRQAADNELGNSGGRSDGKHADYQKYLQAVNVLKAAGVGYTQKEIESQENLVGAYAAQVTIEQKVAELKRGEGAEAVAKANKDDGKDAMTRAKALAEAQQAAVTREGELLREANRKATELIEQGEREQIDATKEGSAARLAAIEAAIKKEEAVGDEGEGFYRGLLTSRINLIRQMGEEEARLRADAAKEAAEHDAKMGQLGVAATMEQMALADSARRVTDAQRRDEAIQVANAELALKMTALSQEAAALDKGGKDYENKLKANQNRQLELTKEHENQVTAIKNKAEEARNSALVSAEQRALGMVASGLTQSIMGHESWAKMLNTFANEAAEGMIRSSILVMMQQDKEKLSNARAAATSAYANGEKIGGPVGVVLGPVFAAAAFAGVMAFEGGGIVPGVGRGDIVPAMLTPGEGVLPKNVMDNLKNTTAGPTVTHQMHYAPTFHVQVIDGDGVRGVLNKHTEEFSRHYQNELRRLNR